VLGTAASKIAPYKCTSDRQLHKKQVPWNIIMMTLLCWLTQIVLRLRYRIRLTGLESVAARGTRGILFLPNHPALIDPVMIVTALRRRFRPRVLADKDQIDIPVIRSLAARLGVMPILDTTRYGVSSRGEVEQAIQDCIAAVRRGDNLLFWPAGRIYRSRFEDLGGNSLVETLLKEAPDIRVVLIRTRGLWGSRFGRAPVGSPKLGQVLLKGLAAILVNGLFFTPRREVSIELAEPGDLPRTQDRAVQNRYLEAFYNQDALPNTHVPYYFWERGGVRTMSEPVAGKTGGELEEVSAATRDIVLAHLKEVTGVPIVKVTANLARDLSMDSLARAELGPWLEQEFGFAVGDVESLQTVADVLMAAQGNMQAAGPITLKPVPAKWFTAQATCNTSGKDGHDEAWPSQNHDKRSFSRWRDALCRVRHEFFKWHFRPDRILPMVPAGTTLTEVFLAQARRCPAKPAMADQMRGVLTYRDILTAIMALKPILASLEGKYLGIMLPASTGAAVLYLAALFAGKIPVMVNWTAGVGTLIRSMDLLGVRRIVTANALVSRLELQGVDLSAIRDRLVLMEDVGRHLTWIDKLTAWFGARFNPGSLGKVHVPKTAVVLFTSGSESFPKAVPLTHANILTNIRDIVRVYRFLPSDRVLGMLPPFHSFGLTCSMLFPLCAGLRVVFHANPTEGAYLARIIETYGVTLLMGTPTFLNGIIRAAEDRQMSALRKVVAAAEKCPAKVYETVAQRWPHLAILEGYGITECSPAISVNDENNPQPGTIGKALPSVEYVIRAVEGGGRVAAGQSGMLLVRGPSVFEGYLNYDGPSPFESFEGKSWYRTGDLIKEGPDGVLTFTGRLKRFVKLGGEMISLPAIEEALVHAFAAGSDQDEGPVLAVESTPIETNPDIVLFTSREISRDEANQAIRQAGLSPLHNIRHVRRVDAIPTLGTGKTDYRSLRTLLASA